MKLQGERFLGFIQGCVCVGGGRRDSKISRFFSYVNERKEGEGWVQNFHAWQ